MFERGNEEYNKYNNNIIKFWNGQNSTYLIGDAVSIQVLRVASAFLSKFANSKIDKIVKRIASHQNIISMHEHVIICQGNT